MKTIEGTVTFVSEKTKGMHLDNNKEAWFNPKGEAKEKVSVGLVGSKISFELMEDNNSFTKFEVLEEPENKPLSKDEFWERKEARDIQQDKARSKGASLNTAVEIMKLSQDRPTDQDGILKEAKELAKEIIKWTQE